MTLEKARERAEFLRREIDENAKKTLKRGLKDFGLLGGIIVNIQTGYTIVSGHQKIALLDDMAHYPENDYPVKVELIDVDQKTEIEINFFMNNNLHAFYEEVEQIMADMKAAGAEVEIK